MPDVKYVCDSLLRSVNDCGVPSTLMSTLSDVFCFFSLTFSGFFLETPGNIVQILDLTKDAISF